MEQSTRQRRGCSPWTLMGCGCGLLGMIGIMLVFLMLGVLYARERQNPAWSRRAFTDCQQNLLYLGDALASYERDHHHLPTRLSELQPRYLDSPSRLHCPLDAKPGDCYQYFPNAKAPTDPVIVCDLHGQARLTLRRNGRILLQSKLFRK